MDIITQIKQDPDRNFFISASAGTGKTFTLKEYYMSILNKNKNNPQIVENILAVTFTNKAAAEMRERIMNEIEKKLPKPNTKSDNSKDFYIKLPRLLPSKVIEEATPEHNKFQNIQFIILVTLFVIIIYIIQLNK